MPSAAHVAARIKKWADVGIDVAIVDGIVATLETDRIESAGRAPRKNGRLATTVRVVKPKSSTAARKGFIIGALAAGNRKPKDAGGVPYARVHQVGGIFTTPTFNATHTARHTIVARGASYTDSGKLVEGVLRMNIGGRIVFARRAKHPGSRFRAQNYVQINESRAALRVDAAIQQSADREVG